MISGQYLPKNYNCYVCLKGFENPNDWFEHCQDKSHFQMMVWCGIKSDIQNAHTRSISENVRENDFTKVFEEVNSLEKLEEILEPVDSPEQHISDSEQVVTGPFLPVL